MQAVFNISWWFLNSILPYFLAGLGIEVMNEGPYAFGNVPGSKGIHFWNEPCEIVNLDLAFSIFWLLTVGKFPPLGCKIIISNESL